MQIQAICCKNKWIRQDLVASGQQMGRRMDKRMDTRVLQEAKIIIWMTLIVLKAACSWIRASEWMLKADARDRR